LSAASSISVGQLKVKAAGMKISTDLALQAFLGHGDELTLAATVHEGFGLEGLNLGVDQGHGWLPARVETGV